MKIATHLAVIGLVTFSLVGAAFADHTGAVGAPGAAASARRVYTARTTANGRPITALQARALDYLRRAGIPRRQTQCADGRMCTRLSGAQPLSYRLRRQIALEAVRSNVLDFFQVSDVFEGDLPNGMTLELQADRAEPARTANPIVGDGPFRIVARVVGTNGRVTRTEVATVLVSPDGSDVRVVDVAHRTWYRAVGNALRQLPLRTWMADAIASATSARGGLREAFYALAAGVGAGAAGASADDPRAQATGLVVAGGLVLNAVRSGFAGIQRRVLARRTGLARSVDWARSEMERGLPTLGDVYDYYVEAVEREYPGTTVDSIGVFATKFRRAWNYSGTEIVAPEPDTDPVDPEPPPTVDPRDPSPPTQDTPPSADGREPSTPTP